MLQYTLRYVSLLLFHSPAMSISCSHSSGHGEPATPRRARRLSSAVEKTVDKLSRSISAKSRPPPPAHRRIFSLNKSSDRPKQSESNTGVSYDFFKLIFGSLATQASSSATPNASQLLSLQALSSAPTVTPNDDCPFVRPPSPPFRPSLTSFRGEGSVCFSISI